MKLFLCVPLSCRLTVAACVGRHVRAKATDPSDVCARCSVGAAHAKGGSTPRAFVVDKRGFKHHPPPVRKLFGIALCLHCAEVFRRTTGNQRFCSRSHLKRYYRRQAKERAVTAAGA